MTKRVLSFLLVLTMLVGMLPVFVQAEETETAVDNGELTVEGTNGFGTLLSEDIAQEQAAMEEQGASGYTLTALEITGNTATVTYDSLEEATVVVALYTEDGMQLLTSGKTTVSPEETQVAVTIEGEMPQYFMAAAYLLDSYDMSPLCPAYDTPMYTQEMQELLASTVEDYDADRVLQLEDSTQTNFAVYAETTKVIEPVEGVNTVVSADDETSTYVIKNADAQFTSLQPGDVVAYAYSQEELLIVKVASLTVNGTTVTLSGDELEMEEAFSHVKLESSGQSEDMTVDDSSASEGVTYKGMISGGVTRAVEGGAEVKAKHEFDFNKYELESSTDESAFTYSIKGSLLFELDVDFNYYVSTSRQYLELKSAFNITLGFYLEGSYAAKVPLGKFGFSPVPGVFVGFEPAMELRFSGKIETSATYNQTVGVRYESGQDPQSLTTAPKVTWKMEMEATVFFGIDLHPNVEVLGKVIELELTALVGVEVKASVSVTGHDPDAKEIHQCARCIALELSFKAELSVKLSFLKCKFLSVSADILKIEEPLGSMYISLDLGTFDWGSCPNRLYRVTVEVLEGDGDFVPEAAVRTVSGKELGTTNSNGVLVAFLESGVHQLEADIWGEQVRKSVNVKEACSVKLSSNPVMTGGNLLQVLDEQELLDCGSLANSGTHGDLRWEYYSGGVLFVYGEGPMNKASSYPWDYCGKWATKVIIGEGITSIAANAFDNYAAAQQVTLPSTLTEIGDYAFAYNYQLTGITIPEGVTSIGAYCFYFAKKLNRIVIPDSVTSIGSYAFDSCEALTEVFIGSGLTQLGICAFRNSYNSKLCGIRVSEDNNAFCSDASGVLFNKEKTVLLQAPGAISGAYTLPDTVIEIAACAFERCSQLTEVTMEYGVTEIGNSAFANCSALVTVNVPNSVETVGTGAFSSCSKLSYNIHDNGKYLGNAENPYLLLAAVAKSNITSCLIHEDTRIIGSHAFDGCYQLGDVYIPGNVQKIGDYAFKGCFKFQKLVIPGNVEEIGVSAFIQCGMTEVVLGSGLISIGEDAFSTADKLTEVTIPDSVRFIGQGAFRSCTSLTGFTFGSGISEVPQEMFAYCSALTEVNFSDSIRTIGASAFRDCDAMQSFTVPDQITEIGSGAFQSCSQLTEIIIGSGVTHIRSRAFYQCEKLAAVTLGIGVAQIEKQAFYFCDALTDVYYAGTQEDWDKIEVGTQNWGLTDGTIHYGSTTARSGGTLGGSMSGQLNVSNAVFGGEYGSETTDTGTVRTADFENLVPGAEYVLLSVLSMDAQEPMAADNLLFIDHAVAQEDGTLSFRYIPRVSAKLSYVMVCGASNKDLADAQITFPEMTATEEIQVPKPQVVYEGQTLTEGLDYVLLGDVDFTDAGVYTCYIRGIYGYTGLVTCTYTVKGEGTALTGSVTTGADGDTVIELLLDGTVADTVTVSGKTGSYSFQAVGAGEYTLRVSKLNHVTREYAVTVSDAEAVQNVKICLIGDVTGDGRVNVGDVAKLYSHIRGTALLTDEYQQACANVNGGKLNIGDCAGLYSHIRGTKKLY